LAVDGPELASPESESCLFCLFDETDMFVLLDSSVSQEIMMIPEASLLDVPDFFLTCFFITCHLYSSVSLDEDDILFNGGDCFFLDCLCFLFVVTEKCELSSQSVEADEEFLHVFPLIVSCAGELSSELSELSRIWLYFFFLFGLDSDVILLFEGLNPRIWIPDLPKSVLFPSFLKSLTQGFLESLMLLFFSIPTNKNIMT
jgi:hypothetical protein